MKSQQLSGIIEAILFVAGEPMAIKDIARNLDKTELEVVHAVEELSSILDQDERGIVIKRFGGHVQLATKASYASYVERMLQPVQRQSLSHAALETLAVVAYRQPVTRLDVEMVRGVKCDYSIQSLLNKNLIQEVGRRESLGRPILYGTTDKFLDHFGLRALDELPEPFIQNAEDNSVDDAILENDLVSDT